MTRIFALFTAFAVSLTATGSAYAAELPERTGKKSKVMHTLDSMGINSPVVKELVSSMDGRVKGGYLKFQEERIAGGTLSLQYELSGGVSKDQIELKFKPDDSNFEYTARPSGLMAGYRLNF